MYVCVCLCVSVLLNDQCCCTGMEVKQSACLSHLSGLHCSFALRNIFKSQEKSTDTYKQASSYKRVVTNVQIGLMHTAKAEVSPLNKGADDFISIFVAPRLGGI